MRNFSNVTIALQFNQKKKQLTAAQKEAYEKKAQKMASLSEEEKALFTVQKGTNPLNNAGAGSSSSGSGNRASGSGGGAGAGSGAGGGAGSSGRRGSGRRLTDTEEVSYTAPFELVYSNGNL